MRPSPWAGTNGYSMSGCEPGEPCKRPGCLAAPALPFRSKITREGRRLESGSGATASTSAIETLLCRLPDKQPWVALTAQSAEQHHCHKLRHKPRRVHEPRRFTAGSLPCVELIQQGKVRAYVCLDHTESSRTTPRARPGETVKPP